MSAKTERPCRCEGYSPEPVAADTFATDRAIGAQVADASALEPVAAEMPVGGAPDGTPYEIAEAVSSLTHRGYKQEAHNLAGWWMRWRTHAAQPAPAVAMSPELERVLDFAWSQACETDGYTQPRVEADILAVRAQAAEAGKVRLPKVNEAIRLLEDWRKFGDLETNEMPYGDTAAFLAAEGKVAG